MNAMQRTLTCAALACVYLVALRPHVDATLRHAVVAKAPIKGIADVASKMSAADRKVMADAYDAFSRAVAGDPVDDPVFPDVAGLRRAHRAMLLCVWRGVLDNKPGEVPGLREAVEGAFDQRIGSDDVLLNPSAKQSAAKAIADIAASIR